jgi:hypothetical protein
MSSGVTNRSLVWIEGSLQRVMKLALVSGVDYQQLHLVARREVFVAGHPLGLMRHHLAPDEALDIRVARAVFDGSHFSLSSDHSECTGR